MARIISLFNHKGGVGKTTLAYNVAWGLGKAGKRVLMVDGDAQCNLTEITVSDSKALESYENKNNVYEYLIQYIQPKPGREITPVEFFSKNENLKLLVGSLGLAELESPMALSVAGIPAMSDIPGNIHNALKTLGADFDFVIVDLSPALSATNQLFLMLSDYFIIPVNPSIFSRQALKNLGEIFRTWNSTLSASEVFSKKQKPLPKLLGIVCQNYRPYSRKDEEDTKSAKRFGDILNELNERAVELATDLSGFRMAVTESEFNELFVSSTPYRIANIPDYNQLAMVSEKEKKPVNALDSKILNKYKINTKPYNDKLSSFKKECESIVSGLLRIP